jgi:hypothetical protein
MIKDIGKKKIQEWRKSGCQVFKRISALTMQYSEGKKGNYKWGFTQQAQRCSLCVYFTVTVQPNKSLKKTPLMGSISIKHLKKYVINQPFLKS